MNRTSHVNDAGHARSWAMMALVAIAVLLLAGGCGTGSKGTAPAPGTSIPSGDVNATLSAAQSALDAGNLSAAEQGFRAVVARDPRSAQAQFGLGNALVRQNKLADAEAAYKAALAIDSNMTAVHANLGVVYYQLGQLSRAADEYNASLRINPSDAQTNYLLAAVRLQESNLPEAERLLLKARDLDPRLPEVYYGLGVLYKLKGQKADAIAAFENFLQIGPGQDPQATEYAKSELKTLKGQ
jgi:tetratricopeptide (TPR) repeat protein